MSITNEVLNNLYKIKQFERAKVKIKALQVAIENDNIEAVEQIINEIKEIENK